MGSTRFAMSAAMLLLPATGWAVPSARPDTPKGLALFEQELAAARRAGLPVAVRDMKRSLLPPARNAATYYAALAKRPVSSADWQSIEVLYSKVAPTPEEIAAASKLVELHRADLDLVHRAAACRDCVLPHDWSRWPVESLAFGEMRQAARWLAAESASLWLTGRQTEAVQTQALGFRISRHAAAERSLISYLVATATDAIALAGMRLMLIRGGDRPGAASAVRRAIEKREPPPSLAYALSGEMASSLATLGVDPDNPRHLYIREGWQFGPLKRSPRSAVRLTPKERREWETVLTFAALDLRFFRSVVPIADLPYPLARGRSQDIVRRLTPIERLTGSNAAEMLGGMLLPALAKRAQAAAVSGTVLVGAAVLEYRTRTGTLPQTLGQAVTPMALDPFDSKPFRYRREGEGFVVYSVGESGGFAGGSPDVRPGPMESVFRWPRPAYAR